MYHLYGEEGIETGSKMRVLKVQYFLLFDKLYLHIIYTIKIQICFNIITLTNNLLLFTSYILTLHFSIEK